MSGSGQPSTALTSLQQVSQAPVLSLGQAEELLNEGRLPQRFLLLEELQRGSLSQVFLVEDLDLQRQAVVKFTDALVHDQLPPSCEHAHVPPIYDSGLVDGLRWTLQRYVPGESLERVLRREPERLSLPARVRIVQTIAETLAAAHERGIVHHDVKPGNILLGAHGDCALIDWDGATHGSGRSQLALQGTPGYMAPEQAAGEASDARADVYALGATLLHLCSGHRPDRLPSGWSWPRAGRWRALRAICATAMATDPAARYADMTVLAEDCRRWLEDEPVSVLPDPWTRRAWRVLRRQRLATVALLLSCIAGLALVVLHLHQQEQRQRHWHPLLVEGFQDPLDPERWQAWVLPRWDPDSAERRPLIGPTAPWSVHDGRLYARLPVAWPGCSSLAYTALSDTDLRLRYQITPLYNAANLNVVFGQHRGQLYTLHLGGWGQPDLVLLSDSRGRRLAVTRLSQPLRSGRSYDLAVRYHSGAVFLSIDGRPVFAYQPPAAREPQHLSAIAVEASQNQLAIDHLRIDRLQLPQLIERQHLADYMEARGDYASALLLLESLPENAATIQARARCLQAMDQNDAAIALLRQALDREPQQGLRLQLAEVLHGQGRWQQAQATLAELQPPLQDPVHALHILDAILAAQLQRDMNWRDRTSLPPAAEAYAGAWLRWLWRWHLAFADWDAMLLPQALALQAKRLVDLFQEDVVQRHLASLHPRLSPRLEQTERTVRLRTPGSGLPPGLSAVQDLPQETLLDRRLRAASLREEGTVQVRTLACDPASLRQQLNMQLIHSLSSEAALQEALSACFEAVLVRDYIMNEVLLPACLLAAIGRDQAARDWMLRVLDCYPSNYVPLWQQRLRRFAQGQELGPPRDQQPGRESRLRLREGLLQGLSADLAGRHAEAAATYAAQEVVMPDWRMFLRWRQTMAGGR